MKVLFIILGMIVGAFVAFLLNKLLANKIENKNQKLVIKIPAYIIFIILGLLFGLVSSLRPMLDKFIDERINTIELILNKNIPNTRIMEININTSEFVEISNQLKESIQSIDTTSDNFFEKLVFDAFTAKLAPYINAVDSGINAVAIMGNEQGEVTLKSILLYLKTSALNVISPYFVIFNILLIIVFFVFIGVYIGVVIYLKKGGAMYNKSIVYGDNQ
jgi:hypothetical protein